VLLFFRLLLLEPPLATFFTTNLAPPASADGHHQRVLPNLTAAVRAFLGLVGGHKVPPMTHHHHHPAPRCRRAFEPARAV
jgi:hypothetical protein